MIEMLTSRGAASGRHRVNHDSLRFAKLVFSVFAVTGFLISIALFLLSTSGIRAVVILAWSSLYLAVVFGLDERRRWGQILAIGILLIQPAVLANLTAPFWQLGAVAGVLAIPLVGYLSQKKVSKLLY